MDESPHETVVGPMDESTHEDVVGPMDGATPTRGEETAPTVYHVMNLDSVLYDLTDASPQAHLIESESPYRYLVIPIALADAIALQQALSRLETRRPTTHELMTSILGRLQVDVIAVRIVRYEQGVFFAELELMTAKGREIFDCRTSDALALAYRQIVPAPVLCADEVFQRYFGD
ncbi:MAG: bifunctional nuclease family protein [Acidobacteriota bacterium]|nr:bifunctional nuclease family protein [Acidobacteriota bacterium]MDE3043383.1 bifunctional nuclease family protein [Acidobacteriota bacterium]MDE3107583.1 bifunctional nuclease family protein [Acidobacteriota bacterium]